MHNYNILVVDDNKAVTTTLKIVFRNIFKNVMTLNSTKSLSGILMSSSFDAVLLDMNYNANHLDGKEGLTWLRKIKDMSNPPAVVLITAFADVPLAVQGLKDGAEDFVTKPWDNDELVEKILKAIEKNKANKSNTELQKAVRELHSDNTELMERLEEEKHKTLETLEKEHIEAILKETSYNLSQSANILGLHRQTLYNKARKHGLHGDIKHSDKEDTEKKS